MTGNVSYSLHILHITLGVIHLRGHQWGQVWDQQNGIVFLDIEHQRGA